MNNKDIQDELKELNSSLSGMSKTQPFSVPEDYFADNPLIISALAQLNSLNKNTATLEVPEGYWLTNEKNILDAVVASESIKKTKKHRTISLSHVAVKWVAAAMVLIMMTLGLVISNPNNNQNISATSKLNAIAPSDIHQYYIEEYNTDLTAINYIPDILTSIDKKDIISYLNETGWEI